MNLKLKKLLIAGLIALPVYGCAGTASSDNSTAEDTEKVSEPAAQPETQPEVEEYTTDLTAGFYTGGIDIPVGDYDVTLVSGSGNVICNNSDKPVNEVFGTDKSFDEIESFNGVGIEKGSVLQILGAVKVKITSKDAQVSSMVPRTMNKDKSVTLSSGNYTAGTDFPAGTYDVVATEGAGNVISTDSDHSEYDINEILSPNPNAEYDQAKEFKNAIFEKGTTLELSDVTVQLIPVSE